MLQVEQHGDVTRFEMTSAGSRILGYSASAYLVGGILVDCGFHMARHELGAILDRERPRGVLITHHHEDHAGNVERVECDDLPHVFVDAMQVNTLEFLLAKLGRDRST